MQHVTVRVPASTSNLGPGFDCLGVALCLYNDVTVTPGKGDRPLPLLRAAAKTFFAIAKCRPFDFSCRIQGDVPIARGLGSSATIRLGLLHALNKLAGANLSRHDLFAITAELEHHPDNAAPASFGGFTVARGLRVQRFDVSPRLLFILLIPDLKIATAKARALLPRKIPHADAVMSGNNAAAITAAFANRDYEQLRGYFADGLHQLYRKRLVPFLDNTINAAEKAGALGAFLSGSGSAICAVTLRGARKIGAAMLRESKWENARIIITRADNGGARVLQSKIR